MEGIKCFNLVKVYRKEKRKEGMWNTLRYLVKKDYEYVKALNGVSFVIEKGEKVGILGPNGAGKTTLMKIMSGVLYPTEGEVRVDGFIPFKRDREFLKRITLFTGQRGFLSLTIWDLPPMDGYSLIKEVYNIPPLEFKRRLDFFIELLNLGKVVNTPLRSLSLGERTKAELVASLLHFPDYIFLDEPTIGMDVVSQKSIWDFLKEYVNMNNATLLLTSHYMRDIEEVCDSIIIISKGRILYQGRTSDIVSEFSNRRRIEVKVSDTPDKLSLDIPYTISENSIFIEVERERVKEIILRVMESVEVLDVTIEEPPLEEVIRELFRRTS